MISVGILTMSDEGRGFRGNRQRFKEWCVAGESRGVDVCIIPHRNWLERRTEVDVYRYDREAGRWIETASKRPCVLYNRIPNRDDEAEPEVRRLMRQLRRRRDVACFNSRFFNKWQLMAWLRKSATCRRYLPKSWRYREGMALVDLLRKHGELYLKPEQGRAGAGIMVARWDADGGARLMRQPATAGGRGGAGRSAVRISHYRTPEAWQQAVQRAIGGERYYVQQGVALLRHRGRPFDLRLLLQKTRHGRWAVTGIGARVAGATSITTHVPRGGSIADPAALLRATFGRKQTSALTRRLHQLAPRIARQIERASGDQLGELSLDIGIDQQARPWLFEANAKPMSFDEPAIHARAISTFFDYCHYLHKRVKTTNQKRTSL